MTNSDLEKQDLTPDEDEKLSGLLQQWSVSDIENDTSVSVINHLNRRRIIYRFYIWGSTAATIAAILLITCMPVKQINVAQLNRYANKQYNSIEQKTTQLNKTETNLKTKSRNTPGAPAKQQTAKPIQKLAANSNDNKNANDITLTDITETTTPVTELPDNKVEVASLAVLNSITETE